MNGFLKRGWYLSYGKLITLIHIMTVHPYENLEDHHFWKTGVVTKATNELNSIVPSNIKTLFESKRIVSAGSCFAENIARELKKRKLNYLDYEQCIREDQSDPDEKFGYNRFSARYGNIYTTIQLKELLEESLGLRENSTIIWQRESMYFDALRPSIHLENNTDANIIKKSRIMHLKAINKLLHDCEVFVFTLGLTEYWLDIESGRALPLAPGVKAGKFEAKKYRHMNQDINEIYLNLVDSINLIKSVNPNVEIILSVSPNPLTASYLSGNILVNNIESKCKLLVAAKRASSLISNISYLPSYEIINNPVSRFSFFKPNLRQVNDTGVETVMSYIFPDPSSVPHSNSSATLLTYSTQQAIDNEDDIEYDSTCDESILDNIHQGPNSNNSDRCILFLGTSMASGPTKSGILKAINSLNSKSPYSISADIHAMALSEFQIQSKESILSVTRNSIKSTGDFSAYSKYPKFTRKPFHLSVPKLSRYDAIFLIDCGFNCRITPQLLTILRTSMDRDMNSLVNLIKGQKFVAGRIHNTNDDDVEFFINLLKALDLLPSTPIFLLPGPPEPIFNKKALGELYYEVSKQVDLQKLLKNAHLSVIDDHCSRIELISYPDDLYDKSDLNFFKDKYSRDFPDSMPDDLSLAIDRHFNYEAAGIVSSQIIDHLKSIL